MGGGSGVLYSLYGSVATLCGAFSRHFLFVVLLLFSVDPVKHLLAGKAGAALGKHAYSNKLEILPPNNENFQVKNLIFSYICSKHRV